MHLTRLQRSALLRTPTKLEFIRTILSQNAAIVVPCIVGGVSLMVYMLTLAPDLTWNHYGGDGGELITASMTLGIPHPPGYPLYTLIGRLFGAIPLGYVAARFSFLSATAAAIAVGLVSHLVTMRSDVGKTRPASAVIVGLTLAFTPLLWGQAVIAEVYALFMMIVVVFLWAILTERSAITVGLVFGLAIVSHLTGLLLLPLALWHIGRSGLVRFAVGSFLGLTPFLLLPWLSTSGSPVTWGEPDTIGGWWWLVSAQLYRPNVFGLATDQLLERVSEWLVPTILLPMLLWLVLAAIAVWRTRGEASKGSAAVLITALIFILYALTYRTPDAAVLQLPAVLLLAVLAGRWLVRLRSPALWLLPALMLIMAAVSLPKSGQQSPRQMATSALANVPANAIVLTPGDATISALWYFQYVERMRPDVVVVDRNMFQFGWYREDLAHSLPDIWMPAQDNLGLFVATNEGMRPVCSLSLNDGNQVACYSPALETQDD